MRTVECPACGFWFVMRRAGRCRRCSAILATPGERFIRSEDDGDELYVLTGDGWRKEP